MAHGHFPFNFGDDFYPSRSGFEDPNQRPMQSYCRPYSLTPSQVQYGPNGVDFWGSSQSSSMSSSASATPSSGSSQQTSSSVGSSDPHNKSKAPVSSSWMNVTLCLCFKTSFRGNLSYENEFDLVKCDT